MIYISEGNEIGYLEATDRFNFNTFLNDKRFTVKDTPLSYRQVNTLDDDKLLKKDRRNNIGWRKFSFKDLVFITVINKLKKFGFQNSQFRELSKLFLNYDFYNPTDLALGLVLGKVEITLTIDSDGKVDIFDPNFYLLIGKQEPHVKICLNDVLNELFVKMGREPISTEYSIERASFERHVLPEEDKLIDIIRDKTYNTITIKKKDGNISVVYAEKTKSPNGQLSENEVIKLLKSKDFQDISIVKRDGKIVSHKVIETIKL